LINAFFLIVVDSMITKTHTFIRRKRKWATRVPLVLSRNNWREKKKIYFFVFGGKTPYSQFGQNHTGTMRKHFIMLLIQKAQHSYTNRTSGQIK